ncbi:MAG: hypothetical protein AAGD13_11825 [Pseudomonadota bacterium]
MRGWQFIVLWTIFEIGGGEVATAISEAALRNATPTYGDAFSISGIMFEAAVILIIAGAIGPSLQWWILKPSVTRPSLATWLFWVVVLPTVVISIWGAALMNGGTPDWLPRGAEETAAWLNSSSGVWFGLIATIVGMSLYALAFLAVSTRIAGSVFIAAIASAAVLSLARYVLNVELAPGTASESASRWYFENASALVVNTAIALAIWIGSASVRARQL